MPDTLKKHAFSAYHKKSNRDKLQAEQRKVKNKSLHKFFKVTTLVLCASLCLWQCSVSLQEYLSFSIKVTTTYQTVDELEFPAMTVALMNPMRRTIVGGSEILKLLVATSLTNSQDEIGPYMKKLNKSCYYEVDRTAYILSKLSPGSLMNKDPSQMTIADTVNSLEFASITKQMTFIKCWWNQVETDCSKIVLNVFTDIGTGFSINMERSLAQNFLGSDTGMDRLNRDYNKTQQLKRITEFNSGSGFTFLINANRDESCILFNFDLVGAGHIIQFHEPRSMAAFKDNPSTLFTTGFKYTVALKPTRYRRRTEHLGKCRSSFEYYIVNQTNRFYIKELCFIECTYELWWKTCQCLPQTLTSVSKGIAKKYHVANGTIPFCGGRVKSQCNSVVFDKMFNSNINLMCPDCKEPCTETKYDIRITAVKFPTENFASFYNVVDFETLKKNYFLLTTQIESANFLVVQESQKFTVNELFIYFGSSLTLFLGMSFTSLSELVVRSILIVRAKLASKSTSSVTPFSNLYTKSKFKKEKHIQLMKRRNARYIIETYAL